MEVLTTTMTIESGLELLTESVRRGDSAWPDSGLSDNGNWSSASGAATGTASVAGLNRNGTVSWSSPNSAAWFIAQIQIPLYSIIFLLAVVGNGLVILTLAQHKRMRTVTNAHLQNLAVSDLLLGVFCMPFTLVGMLLKDFVFGRLMCSLIPYVQAVSVGVSAWTLVAISLERYFAICHPFKSRRWQTLSHAHRIIAIIWLGSLLSMTPIAALSDLQPLGDSGRSKCREEWPSPLAEQAFNIYLCVILLVLPLLIMVITYSLITATLWQGIRTEEMCRDGDDARDGSIIDRDSVRTCTHGGVRSNGASNGATIINSRSASEDTLTAGSLRSNATSTCPADADVPHVTPSVHRSWTSSRAVNNSHAPCYQHVRRSNVEASLANKKRVIKMLFVVVLEFFVCWTPLYVVNTLALMDPEAVYGGLGPAGISFFQLLAYASSCCNPITYCFMNSKFKHAFLSAFGCRSDRWLPAALGSSSSKSATFQLSSRN